MAELPDYGKLGKTLFHLQLSPFQAFL